MHVIHITNNCNRGGSNHVILPVSSELLKKNIKSTFVYLKKPDILKDEFKRQGIRTVFAGKNPINILYCLFKIIKNEDRSKIIFHTHLVHASLIGRFAGKFFNIPVITTRHYQERSKNNFFYILEDLTIKYSNYIIAISSAVQNHLINNKNVNNKKCFKIYNPIINLFKNYDKKLNDNNYKITFVGRLNLIKGVKYLIEAFEEICLKIPNSKLFIIGRDDGCKKELEEQVSVHPYKDKINFTGFLSLEEIKEHLIETDIYVQPSLREGLGISAMEAMSMECPCIFTEIGGLIELANDGKNAILVPDKNSKSIADAVMQINKNNENAKNIAKNARDFILNNFDIKTISDEHYKLYKKTLGLE